MDINADDNDQSGSDIDSVPVTLVTSNHLQSSVIQNVRGAHIIQVNSAGDAGNISIEDVASRKRRDLLARRPSYRKIFNELSDTNSIAITKTEEDTDSNDSDTEDNSVGPSNSSSVTGLQYSQVPGTIQIAPHGDNNIQGIQTLTMSNITSAPQVNTSGATIVQYAQGPDGQFLIPVSSINAAGISYQISPASSLGQGVMVATGNGGSPTGVGEEASRKRELRLLKNREAARECRRKKKEYIKCLENRVALLENQNKTLIEELKSLKELYCQKDVQS